MTSCCGSSALFPTGPEARIGARNNIIIFNEIRDIEYAILTAIDAGQLSVAVENTFMTDTTQFLPVQIQQFDLFTDLIETLTPHGLVSGVPVRFQSTGTLPNPVSQNLFYYAHVITPTDFKICITQPDAVAGINFIDINTPGTGTASVRQQSQSELYYLAWKNLVPSRVLEDQMNQVIQNFKNLQYSIVRKTNPQTQNTFFWELQW
jgi:hypothetical protein